MLRYLFSLFLMLPLFANAGQSYCKFHQGAKPAATPMNTAAHQALEAQYDVVFHHLDLAIERNNKFIKGSVHTRAKVVGATLDTFAFELHQNLTIDSILYQNQKISWLSSGAEKRAVLPFSIVQNQMLELTIFYKGTPPTSGSAAIGDGFSNDNSGRWGNQVTWSLSQPFAAFEWWPCKQALADKIDSSWVFITTDSSNKAASNGILEQIVSLPNGKARYEWKSRHPIDYYLISVAVAQYVDYSYKTKIDGYADSVLIQNYIYNNPQTLPTFKADIDRTGEMLNLFSKLYGVYPFADEKYGHAMAPFSGGMEHQTMTTLGLFDFDLISHELGHQWFGDHVTCSSWSDVFVNEGFASYSEYLANEFLNTKAIANTNMNTTHQNIMQQPTGSVWFADSTNVTRIFDSRLTYDKGGAIIHTMRYVVNNDSVFFLALKSYQQQFKNNVASALEFKSVLETVSGIDFTQFYTQWFYGEGYPDFNAKWNYRNGILSIALNQFATSPSTPLFITPLDINVRRTGLSDTIIRVFNDKNIQQFDLSIIANVIGIGIDPKNWIINTGSVVRDTSLQPAAPNSIDEKSSLSFSLYPNPTTGIFYIDGYENRDNISIFFIVDMQGKQLYKNVINKAHQVIDLDGLATGLYQAIIKNQGQNVFHQRLMITR